MAKGSLKAARPIRLSVHSVRQVVVDPGDEDRFVITAKEAAQACKVAQDVKEWESTFKQFLLFVREWCAARGDKVVASYLSVGDGSLGILIRTKSGHYDLDFEDELTELDLELVKKFKWCVAEVMQVPSTTKECQATFEKAIQLYGDGTRTSTASRP